MKLRGEKSVRKLGLAGCLLLAGALGACSTGNTELSLRDYSTSCAKTDECTAVIIGDVCKCQCGFGAINKTSLQAYQLDRATIACGTVCSPCQTTPIASCDPVTRTCGLETQRPMTM